MFGPKQRWSRHLALTICIIFSWTNIVWAIPLSDRILDSASASVQGLFAGPRNPFQAGTGVAGPIDIKTLTLEGVIAHPKKKGLVLISGIVAWEGERVGKYTVHKVMPGRAVLTWENDNKIIKTIPGYLKSNHKRKRNRYSIAFRDASLDLAVQMLGRTESKNIVHESGLAGQVSLTFDNVRPTTALRSLLKVHGYAMGIENGIIRIGKPDEFEEGFDMQTTTVAMHYGNAEALVPKIKEVLSANGSVIGDMRTNTLAIRDRPHILETVRSLLKKIDTQDKRVRIDAKILAASRDFARSLGIQWGVSKSFGAATVGGTNQIGASDNGQPLNVNNPATNANSGVNLIIGSLSGDNLEATLTAAENKGNVNIISKPSITALNNQPAKIRSGIKFFVKSTSDINIGGSGGTASGGDSKLETIETGVMLTVTPQITGDNKIKLAVQVEESTADFSRTVDGIPSILDNIASTNVLLENKETTVIGGLMRTQKSKERVGIPFLSAVPILGFFFSRKTRTKEDRELMIMITPTILPM